MSTVLSRLFSIGIRSGKLMDYDEAKQLAANRKPGVRRKLAGRDDVQPEILYFLAEDSEPEVRREIAANATTPVQADLILARDADDEVRCKVAHKISSVAPTISDEDRERVGALVTDILQVLAADQLSRVRRILAEELKDKDNISPEIAERLARDDDISVARPMLEKSPLLNDEVLLEIIQSKPVQGALEAISRRAGLGEDLAEAIVATDNEDAITDLLKNGGAQIREETLDQLVERADDVPSWHAPLVGRPTLSSRSVRHLAEFVTDALLDKLQQRDDLDPNTAKSLSAKMRERLDADSGAKNDEGATDEERARQLFDAGALDEQAVGSALNKGERGFVVAALSLHSGLPRDIIQKIVSMASAKGVVSIAWRAGLSVQLAVQLQLRLARIAPASVLKPQGESGYPLSEDEMNWQIEFFAS